MITNSLNQSRFRLYNEIFYNRDFWIIDIFDKIEYGRDNRASTYYVLFYTFIDPDIWLVTYFNSVSIGGTSAQRLIEDAEPLGRYCMCATTLAWVYVNCKFRANCSHSLFWYEKGEDWTIFSRSFRSRCGVRTSPENGHPLQPIPCTAMS